MWPKRPHTQTFRIEQIWTKISIHEDPDQMGIITISFRPRPSDGNTQSQRQPYNYSRKRPFQNVGLNNRRNRKVCFNYRNNGFCRYAFHCRYEHILNENQNRAFHSNINVTDRPNTNLNNQRQMEQPGPFLDEMRSLLTTVKALVESQRSYRGQCHSRPRSTGSAVLSECGTSLPS